MSLAYTFEDPNAGDRHTTQYFEIMGNRAIYHDGWLAGTVHRAPWELTPRRPLQADVWELYDTRADFSLADDLAAENPKKLAEMQALFMAEAVKTSGPTARRPRHRALQRRARRAAGLDGSPHFADTLRRHAGHAGKHLH